MRTRARLLSIVVAATLLAGAAPAHAAAPSFDRAWCDGDADDRAAFAAYMKAVLRAAGVTGDIAYDAEGFTLGSGDRGQLMGLGNTLRDRCQSDDDAPVERAARVFASIFSGNQFVPAEQSEELARTLEAHGANVQFRFDPAAGHGLTQEDLLTTQHWLTGLT